MSSDSPDIDERILLTRVVYQQDMRALATLYLKYHRPIKSYIASYISSSEDIDDLTQEVFLQLCAGKAHYDSRSNVKSYLFGIARNVVHSYHRQKSKISSSETVFIRSINAVLPGNDIQRKLKKVYEKFNHPGFNR